MWRPIEGYECYEVSDQGEVRRFIAGKYKIRKLGRVGAGYVGLLLSLNGEVKTFSIHRLVAKAFIPNPHGYNEIDHINRNKTDNRVENLRWCDKSTNQHNKAAYGKSGHKYIIQRDTKYRVCFSWSPIRKSFETLDAAVMWRNEYLEGNNLLNRI